MTERNYFHCVTLWLRILCMYYNVVSHNYVVMHLTYLVIAFVVATFVCKLFVPFERAWLLVFF